MEIQGQILPNSEFAKVIDYVITTYKPYHILEIGTWKGLGSTKSIIDSIILNNLDCNFISIESNLKFYNQAQKNLIRYANYVNLNYGRIIEKQDILDYCNNEHVEINNKWLEDDLNDIENNANIFHIIPNNIDFLLLDGGEYSTYSEWRKLKSRTKIVAMDDTFTMKCKFINQELLDDKNYNCLINSNDRNGFSVFIKT